MKTLAVASLLLSLSRLAIPLTAAAQNDQRAGAHQTQATTEKAEAELSSGRVDEAVSILKAIPRDSSNESMINHLLGLAYYQKSDYRGAAEFLALSAASSPAASKQHRQAIRLLGMSHYLSGHVAECIPYLEQVNGWDPHDVEIQYTLGNSYIQAHKLDRARDVFASMFSVAPKSAAAYLINAQMMIRQQFEELAERELEKALELDPKLPEANFLLGEMAIYHANVDLGIGLLEKAIAPLQKSIWLNPFFSGPYIVLGKVYLKTGDLANAESMLRHALKMDQNNYSGHYLLAQVLQQAGRSEDAKREFELADQLQKSSSER